MEAKTAGRREPAWRRVHRRPDRSAPRAEAERETKLVLVVEDDPNDWEIYGKILWYNGFDVVCAADGAKALELSRKYRPDLVLLDLGLPAVNGLDLCDELKQRASGADVPVVVLSARPAAIYGHPTRRAGCDRYLEKPQSPLQVLHVVEGLIGRAPPPATGGTPPEMESTRPAPQPSPRAYREAHRYLGTEVGR